MSRFPRRPAAWPVALLFLATACPAPERPMAGLPAHGVDSTPRPTPAPPFDIDKATLDEVLRYARGLEYAAHVGVSDEQALAVANRDGALCPEECRYGPLARIQPEVGAVAVPDQDFRKGRIVGRMISQGPGDYDKLNLGALDTTYVWVRETDAGWQARFVSSSKARERASLTDRPFKPDESHPGRYTRSAARWTWQAKDEGTWFTCGTRCCSV